MNWKSILKSAEEPIKVLGMVYNATPETWKKAKKIHKSYWNLLNSYILHLIKNRPNKDIDWYAKKAKEWVEDRENIGKAFDFKKLPGQNIQSWEMLLETLNPQSVIVAYNKLLQDGVKFSRYGDTESFLAATKENGRQVARKIIGKGSREQQDRMSTIASNFDEILPTLKKVLETNEGNTSSVKGSAAKSNKKKQELIAAFIDVLGELKLDMEIDWKDMELRVRKYFSGRRKSYKNKKQLLLELKSQSKNPDSLKILRRNIPEDAPALNDLFKGIQDVSHESNVDVVDVNARKAYEYLIEINQERRLNGKNIMALHLDELEDLVHVTKNKTWINNMLKAVLLNIDTTQNMFKQVYENSALRKELFLKDYMDEAWEKYDTSVEQSADKFSEQEFRDDFKSKLFSGKGKEFKDWSDYIDNKREAIRSIKLSIPPLFVKFMGELAHALQAEDKGEEQKQLSDAFLEVYSPEEANIFSSNYLKQEGGGFGYMKRVQSPRIGGRDSDKSQYAGRTLPQSPSEYASLVQDIKGMLLDEEDREGDEAINDIWDDMEGPDQERKEYHLAGTFDENAKTEFETVLKNYSNNLEKSIAIEIYDAFINGQDIVGSAGMFSQSPKSKQSGLELYLHVWINFLRFAQNKISKSKDVQTKLETIQREINSIKDTSYYIRLQKVLDEDFLNNSITELAQAIDTSKDDIKDSLIKLVDEKLKDIKDSPEVYITQTYQGIITDLIEMGFVRRKEE